jgi:hypothetical protein
MSVRRIGLTVEQPRDGAYYWIIHEDVRCDGRYQKVESADHAAVSYAEALAEGYGMVQRMNGHEGLHQLRAQHA